MPSRKSILNFFLVNGSLLACGMAYWSFVLMYPFTITILKDYALLGASYITLRNMPQIGQERQEPSPAYLGEFHLHIFWSVVIEATVLYYLGTVLPYGTVSDIIWFIPVSFVFEVFFDFLHYVAHYIMHAVPYLYKNSHKVHHRYRYPSAIVTYYQHPLDIILTNAVPTLIVVYLMQHWLTFFLFCVVNIYKTYIEIAGHTGRHLERTSSFPQCIWLPRALGIELTIDDHDLHHTMNNCNYAKRFTLWDKVFGTYKPSLM